ncbi:MAG: hypothetical protein FWF52_02360 [Candidatus Azobacteroides sp.]|nr:hypothetical protein [Candidatus Azobacteroides sp.]
MNTSGITIEYNTKGIPTFARIDLRKYGDQLKDFFASEGVSVEESPYDPEFVAKIKKSEQQIKNGEFKIIKTEDLWK